MTLLVNKTYLYDGSEQELYTSTFKLNLPNNDKLSFTADNLSNRSLLKNESRLLPKGEVMALAKRNEFGNSSFPDEYLNSNLLPVYVAELTSSQTGNRYVVVSASGEKQPMRFFLVIEGVWLIDK